MRQLGSSLGVHRAKNDLLNDLQCAVALGNSGISEASTILRTTEPLNLILGECIIIIMFQPQRIAAGVGFVFG